MITALKEKIDTAIAKALECLARDPKRAERLLGDVKKWSAEAEREAYMLGKADAERQRVAGKPVAYRVSDPAEPDIGSWLSEDKGATWQKSEPLYAAPQARAEMRGPDGYAYRYRYHSGGTVIRFNTGQEENGSRPIEAVPYCLGSALAARAAAKGAEMPRCPQSLIELIQRYGDERADGKLESGITMGEIVTAVRQIRDADRQQRGGDDLSGVQPPMRHIAGVSVDVLRRAALAAQPAKLQRHGVTV